MREIKLGDADSRFSFFDAVIEIVFQGPRHRFVQRDRAADGFLISCYSCFVGFSGD
jgi:hypothetical protein